MANEKSNLLLLVSCLLFTVILAHSLIDKPRYNGFKIITFSEVAVVFSGLHQGKGKKMKIFEACTALFEGLGLMNFLNP